MSGMLIDQERNRIKAINRRNEYCLSPSMMKPLFKEHEAARKRGDSHAMERIEYRLTDINFHYECGLLFEGRYDMLDEVLQNW